MIKHFLINLTLNGKPVCQIDYPNRKKPINIDGRERDVINHDRLCEYIEKKDPNLKGKPYKVESMCLKTK